MGAMACSGPTAKNTTDADDLPSGPTKMEATDQQAIVDLDGLSMTCVRNMGNSDWASLDLTPEQRQRLATWQALGSGAQPMTNDQEAERVQNENAAGDRSAGANSGSGTGGVGTAAPSGVSGTADERALNTTPGTNTASSGRGVGTGTTHGTQGKNAGTKAVENNSAIAIRLGVEHGNGTSTIRTNGPMGTEGYEANPHGGTSPTDVHAHLDGSDPVTNLELSNILSAAQMTQLKRLCAAR